MTEDEDFQYVVSREDYHELKNSKAKCHQLTQLLSEAQFAYSQDKKSYLDKIEVLEQELRSYKVSVRQYVDREIKQIDGLLKMLGQYRSSQEGSSLNLSSLDKIRSECEKISQQFTLSLKDLEIINCEVITVIRNLVSDSLSLHEKLKEYQEMYDQALQEKQDLYGKLRTLNEKNIFLEKERERFLKGQQRLRYQNEILKFSVKQKQSQNLELEIDLHNQKNKHNEQMTSLREENLQKERKLKETLDITSKDLKEQLLKSENDKNIMRRYLTEQIENLRDEVENIMEQLEKKKRQIKYMEVALQQHKLLGQQSQEEIQRIKENSQKKEEIYLSDIQKIRQEYERKIDKMQDDFGEKQRMSLSVIDDMEEMLKKQVSIREKLQNDFREMRDNQSRLISQIQSMKSNQSRLINEIEEHKGKLNIERETFSQTFSQLREQLQDKTIKLEEIEQNVRNFRQIQNQYEERYTNQEYTLNDLRSQLQNSEQHISELQTKLRIKAQQLQKIQAETTKINRNLSDQIQQLRKVVAICESQKTILQQNSQSLSQELIKFKKLYQQSLRKLGNQNQQLIIQLKITVDNLEKKKQQVEEITAAINEIKMAKNNVENQYCQLAQLHQQEKDLYQQQLSDANNQIYILRSSLQEKQQMEQKLIRANEELRNQVKNTFAVQQSSNLLKMDLEALQNDVQRLNKQKNMIKKQRQSLSEQLSQSRMELKFLNDELNSMKLYIDQLEQNLQKLSQEKIALKNQMNLFKEQAEFCKRENIEQLGIIDHLERDLESTKYIFIQNRKQLKTVSDSTDPLSIVKRSSLSKGEKAYYVKEMIMEYRNEMKKNLENIGALSHEEINELISSELRELGNFVKKLQNDF